MAYMEKEGSREVLLVGYYNVLFYLTQTSHTDKVFCTLKIQYFSQ